MQEIKQSGNRFYRWSVRQMRSFPIAKTEVEKLVAAGEAVIVKEWFFEREAEPVQEKPQNVVSLTERRQQKQEQAEIEAAKARFMAEIMPNLSQETLLKLAQAAASGNHEAFQVEMMRAMMEAAVRGAK